MKNVNQTPQSIEQNPTEDEAVNPDKKTTQLDKMIEEFKLSNPVKNKKKIHKGVF
jgi:hypothetical protein